MAWITIPNEVVKTFTGRPMRAQKLNADLEFVFRPIKCATPGCEATFTTGAAFSEHTVGEHGAPGDTSVPAQPVNEDATAARVIIGLLLYFNRNERDNPLLSIRKPNDAFHSTETWRRVSLALLNSATDIRLKKEQYDWLHQLLDRKLPLAKEAREQGVEQQTVGMAIYGLDEDSVRQALTTLPDRRRAEVEDPA